MKIVWLCVNNAWLIKPMSKVSFESSMMAVAKAVQVSNTATVAFVLLTVAPWRTLTSLDVIPGSMPAYWRLKWGEPWRQRLLNIPTLPTEIFLAGEWRNVGSVSLPGNDNLSWSLFVLCPLQGLENEMTDIRLKVFTVDNVLLYLGASVGEQGTKAFCHRHFHVFWTIL